jgi:four helix bundle protein
LAKESCAGAASVSADENIPTGRAIRAHIAASAVHVAEGSKRLTNTEYARFLNIAEGSLAETEYLLMVSRDLGYLPQTATRPLLTEADEIAKMLNSLRVKVSKAL